MKSEVTVVMGLWGSSVEHIMNARHAILELKEQPIGIELIFVEFTTKDNLRFECNSLIDKYIGMDHFESKHAKIFHKESLWNIGVKHATNEKLIFLDADVWCDDPTWIESIVDKLDESSNTVVHGFSKTIDKDPEMCFMGSVYKHQVDPEYKGHVSPGIAYGMNRTYFDAIGGFNNLSIATGSDSEFLEEISGIEPIPTLKAIFNAKEIRNYLRVLRRVPQAKLTYVPHVLEHGHHGTYDSRRYIAKLHTQYSCEFTMDFYVSPDEHGLLCWNDMSSKEYSWF